MVNKDDRGEYDFMLEGGTLSGSPSPSNGTRPSISAGRIRRPLLLAVCLLLLVSLVSSAIVLWHVKLSNLTLGHLDLNRTEEGVMVGESWRIINSTACALAPIDTTERPTLAETFSTPECIDAWIATGTLCDRITAGQITKDMRDALKLSIIHTWVNGSDQQLHAWKETVAKSQRPPSKGRILWLPGDAARHFRCFVFYSFVKMDILTTGHVKGSRRIGPLVAFCYELTSSGGNRRSPFDYGGFATRR
jgi:hypothetical protein